MTLVLLCKLIWHIAMIVAAIVAAVEIILK